MTASNTGGEPQVPRITVLMAVYNGGPFLREAVDSVLAQTFRDFEFIIVNDGSGDDTAAVLRSFTDDRVRVLTNESNRGLVYSLNRGLAESRGAFIARMDADDVAMPERLELQYQVFLEDPLLIACGTQYIIRRGSSRAVARAHGSDQYLKSLLLFASCFNHPTVMMRFSHRGLIHYDEHTPHAEDYELWTRLALSGKFRILERPLLIYREHSSQVSRLHRVAQQKISSGIRYRYLQMQGFSVSPDQRRVHDKLGDNLPAADFTELKAQERWLLDLVSQNEALSRFTPADFNRLIRKYWFDACGLTSLGPAAWRLAVRSPLARLSGNSFSDSMRLLVKTVLRYRP